MLEGIDPDSLEDAEEAQQASVVRLVNEILTEAIEARASDIHIESQEAGLKIRHRIDGVLQRQPSPPEMNQFRAAIISRLKIMTHTMSIDEKRVPQDGRIQTQVNGRPLDLRVSTIPTSQPTTKSSTAQPTTEATSTLSASATLASATQPGL